MVKKERYYVITHNLKLVQQLGQKCLRMGFEKPYLKRGPGAKSKRRGGIFGARFSIVEEDIC